MLDPTDTVSTKRTCLFCGTVLNASNRAKEHVLRRKMLAKLGHLKTNIARAMYRMDRKVGQRSHDASNLLTGEICKQCNNGWMNRLDQQVEPILLALSMFETHADTLLNLTERQARPLARWILKTACAFSGTEKQDRRHIPQSLLHRVRDENFLPKGFVAFVCLSRSRTKRIEIANLDIWNVEARPMIDKFNQSTRMKFAVRYDNVVIGCVWMSQPEATFVFIEDVHYLIMKSEARVRFRPFTSANWNIPAEKGTNPSTAADVVSTVTSRVLATVLVVFDKSVPLG